MNPTEFHLSDAFFRRLRTLQLTYTTPLLTVAVAIGIYSGRRNGTSWVPSVVSGAFMSTLLVVVLLRAYRKQVRQWKSFRINLSGDSITRTQDGYPTVTLNANAVSRIRTTPGQGMSLWTSGGTPVLNIPETLDRYDECRAILAHWCRIEELDHKPLVMRFRWPLSLTLLAAFFYLNHTNDQTIVVVLGIPVVVLLLVSHFLMRMSPDIDRRTKRLSWVALIGIIEILFRIYVVVRASGRQ